MVGVPSHKEVYSSSNKAYWLGVFSRCQAPSQQFVCIILFSSLSHPEVGTPTPTTIFTVQSRKLGQEEVWVTCPKSPAEKEQSGLEVTVVLQSPTTFSPHPGPSSS